MAAWEVPVVLAAAFVGVNKWLNKKLKEEEEKRRRAHESENRYQLLADGVVPDLYQFYQEMDTVIDSLHNRKAEMDFHENMGKFVDFLCVCKEPDGVPTVQNVMMMAMSAASAAADNHEGLAGFSQVFRDQLLGEIERTSPNLRHKEQALEASANLIKIMFTGNSSELSTYKGRRVKGV